MIGEYVNTGRGRRVTISPAVPGAQYRITAGELGDGTWSDTAEVVNVTTGEASEFCRAFSNCKLYTTTDEGSSEPLKHLLVTMACLESEVVRYYALIVRNCSTRLGCGATKPSSAQECEFVQEVATYTSLKKLPQQ